MDEQGSELDTKWVVVQVWAQAETVGIPGDGLWAEAGSIGPHGFEAIYDV